MARKGKRFRKNGSGLRRCFRKGTNNILLNRDTTLNLATLIENDVDEFLGKRVYVEEKVHHNGVDRCPRTKTRGGCARGAGENTD